MKHTITIRLDTKVLTYYRNLSRQTGIPYQTLINSYLADAATNRRRPSWYLPPARHSSDGFPT